MSAATDRALAHGAYGTLARDYARYRAGYAPGLPATLLALARPASGAVRVVDVGAGTGIWTRAIAAAAGGTVAVEPDPVMAALGRRATAGLGVAWRSGRGECTGLPGACCELLTVASALHWMDFARATAEFRRVLRPGGTFAALWNTRVIDGNPLLEEIEAELGRLVPGLRRVSSGRSPSCESLGERLAAEGGFEDVRAFEAGHVERMSPARYLGLWRSVNDARVQAGERRFASFLRFVEARTRGLGRIEAAYRTRVWTARNRAGSDAC